MERFEFPGLNGIKSVCGLTRYGDNIFVLTATDYAKGTSITNAAEIIATEIVQRYGVPIEKLVQIEEYPDDKFARYSLVTFKGGQKHVYNRDLLVSDAEWSHLSEKELKNLIKKNLKKNRPA